MLNLSPELTMKHTRTYDSTTEREDAEGQIHGKLIPFRDSPFHRPGQEEERIIRATPKWIELFFDLAWTMSFAGLNQGTSIKGSTESVWSYIVFFVLVWTMWAQQTIYHTRYYSDDAWNRIVLIFQFLMLGFIAAFTNEFDISLGISHGFVTGNVALEALPRDPDYRYGYRGFQALAVIFFVSRLLLVIEYADVYRIAIRQQIQARPLRRMIAALSISAALFLASFIVAAKDARDPASNIIKFVLWGLAIVIELLAYVATEFPGSTGTRISVSPMEERLCALTIIIIGEGLNSSIEPIVGTTRSIGFNFASGAEIFAWGFTIFLIDVLYVSSFNTRPAPSPLRQRLVTVCHLPLQLFIILFAEGAKAVLSVVTLNNSLLAVAPLLQQCRLKPIVEQISILPRDDRCTGPCDGPHLVSPHVPQPPHCRAPLIEPISPWCARYSPRFRPV